MPGESPLYSVIIPVYNSEPLVEKTVRSTIEFFRSNQIRYEIVLINDHSSDGSWQKISDLAREEDNVIAINLLRNYGQHSAVFCGIKNSSGDFLITMDDDLQNPPEEIIHLINQINDGYDAVFAKFHQKRHGLTRRLGSKIVGYLNYKIFSKPKGLTLSNFRIFTRKVADRMVGYNTFYPYIPGLILMFSSNMANVDTDHKPREIGESNYSLFAIIKLVARLLFNYSSFPLKILTTIGFIISLSSFAGGAFYVVKAMIFGTSVQGWPTLVVLLSFLNGFIIIMLGVIGEYLTRIMNQLSVEDAYQVKEIVKYGG